MFSFDAFQALGIGEVLQKYPRLKIVPDNRHDLIIGGHIEFSAYAPGEETVSDSYKIEIEVPSTFPESLPRVWDKGIVAILDFVLGMAPRVACHYSICQNSQYFTQMLGLIMRMTWAIIIMLLLNGCVTTQDYPTIGEDQQACEQDGKDFPKMVDCLNQKVTAKTMRRQPNADLYLGYVTKARDLAQKVRDGRVSESTARKILAKEKTDLDQHLAERQSQYYEAQRRRSSEPAGNNDAAILNCIQAANSIPRSGIGGPAAAISSCYDNPSRAEDRFQREKEDMERRNREEMERRNRKMECKPNHFGTALECEEKPF